MLYSIEGEKKKKKNLFLRELIISAVKYFTVYFIEKSFRKCSTIVWYFRWVKQFIDLYFE